MVSRGGDGTSRIYDEVAALSLLYLATLVLAHAATHGV
jgi:hypothetical protein